MRRVLTLVLLSSSFSGACTISGREPAIVLAHVPDPFVDPLDAVLRVKSRDGECTGTVVAPRVVLTSRPCLVDIGAVSSDKVIDPGALRLRARLGGGAVSYASIPVSAVEERECLGVAALITHTPLAVAPLRMRLHRSVALGESVRVVGFGRCTSSAIGARGVGFAGPVRAVTSTSLHVDAHACAGDVGGPVVSAGSQEVIGILLRDPIPIPPDHPSGKPIFDVPAGEAARLDGEALPLILRAVLSTYGVEPAALPGVACP
ncbi:MAG: trypsin-like serine protease [Myxococcales bacterium]|nr:trypsin-like serine protease [Myxococcales bacterium]